LFKIEGKRQKYFLEEKRRNMFKRILNIAGLILIVALLSACATDMETASPEVDFSEALVEEYQQEANARLDLLEQQAADLRTDIESTSEEAKVELNERVDNLEKGIADARLMVDALSEKTAETWNDAKGETQRAIDDLEQIYHEQYLTVVEARLEQLEAQITDLRGQLENADEAAAAELESLVTDLETQADDLRTEIDGLRNASVEAWDEVQEGVENAAAELEQAYNEAQAAFQ
jgi:hypothetical protein